MRTTLKAGLAGALALGLWAAPMAAQQGTADSVPGAPWVERATDAVAKLDVIPRLTRPAMKSYTDSYIYGSNTAFGVDPEWKVTIDPNGYDQPVTLYLYWQNRANEQRRYYNMPSGGWSNSEVDLFGTGGTPVQVFVPALQDFTFFGPGNDAAFGPYSQAQSTGQYQLVLEIRDPAGEGVVNFANAMFNFVDGIVPKGGTLGSETWTANNAYVVGVTDVPAGAVLTIEPGTFVLGDNAGQGRLAILPGGQIQAAGSELQPIVFTSEFPRAQRQKGDWGGMALSGNAPCNVASPIGEGETGEFCGDNPNDSSGTLSYVRIEYAGIRFTDDNELNCLALQGVGAGTTLSNIQCTEGLDDGFEFFGGTANAENLLALNNEDDSLDWTFGWTGSATNVCLVQVFGESDKLIEADSLEDNPNAEPRSVPTITNLTGVTNASTGSGANADDAFVIRRGSGILLSNAAVYGVVPGEAAVFLGDSDLSEDPTYGLIGTGQIAFNNTVVSPNNATLIVRADGAAISPPAGLSNGNGRAANPTSPIQPDLQPVQGSTGCTSANNDWTKGMWINWDYGVRE